MVHTVFAAALDRQRDTLNARFAEAARLHRNLEGDEFKRFLVESVQPAVLAADAGGFSGVEIDRLTLSMCRVGLQLLCSDIAGPSARFPFVEDLWRDAFPVCAQFFRGEAVRDHIAALTNAVTNLEHEGLSAGAWIAELQRVAPSCADVNELLAAGQVLAWRLGLAHFRDSALEVLAGLPPSLAAEIIGLDPALVLERWIDRGVRVFSVAAELGNFVGLGGGFVRPPTVSQVAGQIYATDGVSSFSLHADRFGATLKRCVEVPVGAPASSDYQVVGQRVVHDYHGEFQPPAGASSVAGSDDMGAFTLAHSHRVFVVAPAAA